MVITNLTNHHINFGNTFHDVVFPLSSEVCLAAGSFLIHLPINGTLILSIMSLDGSHQSHHAVSQLLIGLDQSLLIGFKGLDGSGAIGATGAGAAHCAHQSELVGGSHCANEFFAKLSKQNIQKIITSNFIFILLSRRNKIVEEFSINLCTVFFHECANKLTSLFLQIGNTKCSNCFFNKFFEFFRW